MELRNSKRITVDVVSPTDSVEPTFKKPTPPPPSPSQQLLRAKKYIITFAQYVAAYRGLELDDDEVVGEIFKDMTFPAKGDENPMESIDPRLLANAVIPVVRVIIVGLLLLLVRPT